MFWKCSEVQTLHQPLRDTPGYAVALQTERGALVSHARGLQS